MKAAFASSNPNPFDFADADVIIAPAVGTGGLGGRRAGHALRDCDPPAAPNIVRIPVARKAWQPIGALAELERSLMAERTRRGLESAQCLGAKLGRKPKRFAEQVDHARKLIEKNESRQYVADLSNKGRANSIERSPVDAVSYLKVAL